MEEQYGHLNENEATIQTMGAEEAVRKGLLTVIGKDTDDSPAYVYLLIVTSDPKRGCTYDRSAGYMSKFNDLQLFYKFGAWYDADHFDEE